MSSDKGEAEGAAPDLNARVQSGMTDAPAFYVNSFVNLIGSSDICTVFERNGSPALVLNMSFTTAKSYAILLGQLVARLEEKTGRDIMTTDAVEAGMNSSEETIQ